MSLRNNNKVNEKIHMAGMRKVSRVRTKPRRLTIERVMTFIIVILTI